jgi:hypothetical protein
MYIVQYVAAGAKNRVTFNLWPQIMISFTIRNNATEKNMQHISNNKLKHITKYSYWLNYYNYLI